MSWSRNRPPFTPIVLKMYNRDGRARRGASGALWPTIRSSGVESPVEASLFLAGASARGVEGRGPARRAAREPRQDRKVAAVTGGFLARQSALPEPAAGDTQGECCRSRVHGHPTVANEVSGGQKSAGAYTEADFCEISEQVSCRGSSRQYPSPPREVTLGTGSRSAREEPQYPKVLSREAIARLPFSSRGRRGSRTWPP
jgi:hypothetical protein